MSSDNVIYKPSESRGVGFAALWIALQVLLTAGWAVGRLWFTHDLLYSLDALSAVLNDRVLPEQSWMAPATGVWSGVVGLLTLLASGAVVFGSRRMVVAATLWSVSMILLATMSTIAFGFHWSSIPILASAAVLVFAVHQHWSRAA